MITVEFAPVRVNERYFFLRVGYLAREFLDKRWVIQSGHDLNLCIA